MSKKVKVSLCQYQEQLELPEFSELKDMSVSCGLYMSYIRLRINVGLSYVLSKRATQRDTPSNKMEVNSEFLGL